MKLFVGYKNNKFIKNIILARIKNVDILSGFYANNLYRIHQQKLINCYLFSDQDLLSREVDQFIYDYQDRVKFLIYHPNTNKPVIDRYNRCHHLVHDNLDNCIKIPNLINTDIFYMKNHTKEPDNAIISFIDHLDHIPDYLDKLLYPNSSRQIKLYGETVLHHQCLGLVSESDKADLLCKSSHYLSLDNSYAQEARLCGCSVYSIESIINNTTINDSIDMNYQSYSEFLKDILI